MPMGRMGIWAEGWVAMDLLTRELARLLFKETAIKIIYERAFPFLCPHYLEKSG